MRKVLKYFAVNLFVLAALITLMNLAAVTIFKTKHFLSKQTASKDPRADLPNYRGIPWAAKHFEEFNHLPATYRSYIGWRRLPYDGETIHVDSNGIRLSYQAGNVCDTTPLIAFLGGSTMWGTGVPDSLTIPSIFSTYAGKNYRVVNLGESDYNALQSFIFLHLQIMQGLKPFIVISYDGVNNAFVQGKRRYSDSREQQIASMMQGKDRDAVQGTMQFSNVIAGPVKYCINSFLTTNTNVVVAPPTKAQRQAVAEELLESWLAMKQLCGTIGAHFIAVLQPHAYVGHPKIDHLLLSHAGGRDYSYYADVAGLLKQSRYQSLAPHVLNYTNKFDLAEYIYIDDFHVSPNGNRIIARSLYYDVFNEKISTIPHAK